MSKNPSSPSQSSSENSQAGHFQKAPAVYHLPLLPSCTIDYHHAYSIILIEGVFLILCFLLNCVHYGMNLPELGDKGIAGTMLALALLQIALGFAFIVIFLAGLYRRSPVLVSIHFRAEFASVPILLVNFAFPIAVAYGNYNARGIFASHKPTTIVAIAFLCLFMAIAEVYFAATMREFSRWFDYETDVDWKAKDDEKRRKMDELVRQAELAARQVAAKGDVATRSAAENSAVLQPSTKTLHETNEHLNIAFQVDGLCEPELV